ncbi:MAG: hypothetical protein JSV35_06330 [Candidatus Bathyarchaeota archaeon]|nr:MAG: hypothetical protein JSV35_06330 [Candidatus Bathyarchaeota archaeon]
MRRSRLQKYLQILNVLTAKPKRFEKIAYETNLDVTVLKKCIEFLMSHNLVVESRTSKKTAYTITERGLAVCKALRAQKYFEMIRNTISNAQRKEELKPTLSRSRLQRENE